MMGYLVGALLSLAVAGFARRTGFDRDRAFYPTIVIVVASYYVLFAVMGGSTRALALETVVMGAFVWCAVIGLTHRWVIVTALAAHGLFDFAHAYIIDNPGVPAWWPAFCLAFDVGAAAVLAWLSAGRAPGGDA